MTMTNETKVEKADTYLTLAWQTAVQARKNLERLVTVLDLDRDDPSIKVCELLRTIQEFETEVDELSDDFVAITEQPEPDAFASALDYLREEIA